MMSGVPSARHRSIARVIFSPTTTPHAATNKLKLESANLHFPVIEQAAAANYRVGQLCGFTRLFEPLAVGLRIHKAQRIG